jgi:hypothetical protein
MRPIDASVMELSLGPRTPMTHELGLDAKARFGVGAVIPRVEMGFAVRLD